MRFSNLNIHYPDRLMYEGCETLFSSSDYSTRLRAYYPSMSIKLIPDAGQHLVGKNNEI